MALCEFSLNVETLEFQTATQTDSQLPVRTRQTRADSKFHTILCLYLLDIFQT